MFGLNGSRMPPGGHDPEITYYINETKWLVPLRVPM